MRAIVAGILLVLLAQTAAAQTVTVRSGEHDGFTRLVFDLPQSRDWTLTDEGAGTGIDLVLDGAALLFDTDRVFDRIATDRVASVEALDARNGVRIGLNCRCDVSAFRFGEAMLVLDIRDGGEEADAAAPVSGYRCMVE